MKSTTVYRVALGEDRQPDAWQAALATNAWPRVLIAPTGSGKTAELQAARDRWTRLTDVAPLHLPPPGDDAIAP